MVNSSIIVTRYGGEKGALFDVTLGFQIITRGTLKYLIVTDIVQTRYPFLILIWQIDFQIVKRVPICISNS